MLTMRRATEATELKRFKELEGNQAGIVAKAVKARHRVAPPKKKLHRERARTA